MGLLSFFNRGPAELDPSKDADLGDGFLTQQGYTLVWVGWQFDVPRQGRADDSSTRRYPASAASCAPSSRPNDRALEYPLADLAGYSPSDPAAADATLTVRDGPFGATTTIPRGQWRLRGNNVVSIDGGFEPGRTYEVAYRAANLPVAAAGLAAFRDTASWLKYRSDATVSAKYAYTFGSSQSGRFLRAFLYYGFNSDEQGRQVFDGVMAHKAGTGRLSLNERGATPNARSMYTATKFPFSDARQRDPNSGRTEGLLDNDRARQNQPKIFYTNTSVEYWGGGRAAALVHTTLDGKSDLTPPANVRVYLLAGTQHTPARFPPRVSSGQQIDNPVEFAWTLRALLTGMDRWVRQGTAPPPSQHPRLADGSLVAGDRVAFPAIPGVASPRTIPAGRDGSVVWPLLVPRGGRRRQRARRRARPGGHGAAGHLHGLELPQPGDRRTDRARGPAGIGGPVCANADGARSGPRSAALDRRTLSVDRRVSGPYPRGRAEAGRRPVSPRRGSVEGRRARPGALGPSRDDDQQSVATAGTSEN